MSARPPAPSVDRARPRRALAYRLCSLSSASLDRYPENRPTRFTHHLPSRFFLDPGKQYVVSLLSLSLTSERLENWSEPSYVRVHLAQLEQNAFDSPGRVRCRAQLVLPDRTRDPASATALDRFDLCSPIPVLLDPTLPSLDTLVSAKEEIDGAGSAVLFLFGGGREDEGEEGGGEEGGAALFAGGDGGGGGGGG